MVVLRCRFLAAKTECRGIEALAGAGMRRVRMFRYLGSGLQIHGILATLATSSGETVNLGTGSLVTA